MAVHKNRHLADIQYIAAVGIIRDQYGNPHLLAESLNPQHYQEEERQPPLLLLALPESPDKAKTMGNFLTQSNSAVKSLGNIAKGRGLKKTDVIEQFRDTATYALDKHDLYNIRQYSQQDAKNTAAKFERQAYEFSNEILNKNGDVKPEHINQFNALNKIDHEISNGYSGHIFRMAGFVATSPSKDMNVFDGFEVDFPDPNDPSVTYKRPVVTATAIGLKPIMTPDQAIQDLYELSTHQQGALVDNKHLTQAVEDVSMSTQRLIIEKITPTRNEEQSSVWTNQYAGFDEPGVHQKNLLSGTSSEIRGVQANLLLQNETILAAGKIPTITESDKEKRRNAIQEFHKGLGEAIENYNKMRQNGDGRSFKNSGLVLEVWSKSPDDSGKNGAKNGYKTRAGYGLYVDLQATYTSDEMRKDRNAPGKSIINQLETIVNYRDKATEDYLGPVYEGDDKTLPKFIYKQSMHSQLTDHLRNLVKSELNNIKSGMVSYLGKMPAEERQTPEAKEIERLADPKNNLAQSDISRDLAHLLRNKPGLGKEILKEANLDSKVSLDIQRTTSGLVDIEKKYAAVTGLRSTLLAERDRDMGPIIINPNNPELGQIQTPEWFHKGTGGLNDKFFKNTLLPTKQFRVSVNPSHPGAALEKVDLKNMPLASSVYGELMKDMANMRHDDLQNPELQKNRILTHPTFQINTVVRHTDPRNPEVNKSYNSDNREEYENTLKKFSGPFAQILPAPQSSKSSASNIRAEEQHIFNEHGLAGTALSVGSSLSVGQVAERIKQRQGLESISQIKAETMDRVERLNASNLGNSITHPIAAYKPYVNNRGKRTFYEMDNSRGSFENLEGKQILSITPAILVQKPDGAPLNTPTPGFITVPQIDSRNPMVDLSKVNAALENSAKSVHYMKYANTPGLQQLQELAEVASAPVRNPSNFVNAILTMNKDKNDVSNTRDLGGSENRQERDKDVVYTVKQAGDNQLDMSNKFGSDLSKEDIERAKEAVNNVVSIEPVRGFDAFPSAAPTADKPHVEVPVQSVDVQSPEIDDSPGMEFR